MKNIVCSLFLLLFSICCFGSDILVLNNQMAFEGKVVRIKGCSVVFKAASQKYIIPASDIYCLQFEDVEDKVYTKYLALADSDPSKCLKANDDARLLHGKKGGHYMLGMLFGPFAIVGTLLSNPLPYRGKDTYMLSENRDLFKDPVYLKCYMQRAKSDLILMEILGWATWALIVLIISSQ